MEFYAVIARLCAGIMLIVVWGLTDSPLSGVAFMLVLTALSAARYRLKTQSRLMRRALFAGEIIVCIGYAFVWLPALLGLWFALIGVMESKWSKWEAELLKKSDGDREARLKLERERENAASRLQEARHAAELAERSRIAQNIHDHVGHEISGALIALQTALKLYQNGDEKCGEILAQVIARLESASANLRETVHNLKPAQTGSSESICEILQALCDDFTFCKAEFQSSGDLNGIETHYLELLAANLKEALTNVSRHSNASRVDVSLDCNGDYIRMIIADNAVSGDNGGNIRFGLGLTGMKERVRNANGTLTVSTDSGFKIVCVLPV